MADLFAPSDGLSADWLVITSAGEYSSGGLIDHLVKRLRAEGRQDVRVLEASATPFDTDTIASARLSPRLLILPRRLDPAAVNGIIDARSSAGQITHLFAEDTAFFCLADRNHVAGELYPCLRCIGGVSDSAHELGCLANHHGRAHPSSAITRLHELCAAGHVEFLANGPNLTKLIQAHFGGHVPVRTVDLWRSSWSALLDRIDAHPIPTDTSRTIDVAVHTDHATDRASRWIAGIARKLPGVRFLLSFQPQGVDEALPRNLAVHPEGWDDEFEQAIRTARIALVPTLWSSASTDELVNVLVAARSVAVLDSPTCSATELPDGLLARLAPTALDAARRLADLLQEEWQPDAELRSHFLRTWTRSRDKPTAHILPPLDEEPPSHRLDDLPTLVSGDATRVMEQLRSLHRTFPRGRPGRVEIGGRSLRFADMHGLYYQYHQIFEQRLYGFAPVRPAPYILDCGAHIGLASLFFADCHPDCSIDAFEADPQVAALAAENLQANGAHQARVHAKAVWVHENGVSFKRSGDDSAHIGGDDDPLVPTVRLKDSLTGERQIDMLKMDIEGAEYAVLADCAEALHRIDRMAIEVHHLTDNQGRIGDVLHLLSCKGFDYMLTDLHHADWAGGTTPPFDALTTDKDLVTVLAWRNETK